VSKKGLKYKLDISEVIAFILAMILLIAINHYLSNYSDKQSNDIIIFAIVLSFFSAMFGPFVGGLTGFLGIISAYNLRSNAVQYPTAIAMMAFGYIIGRYANEYKIRDGRFEKKQITLFVTMECIASLTAFVFIKPFVEYVISDINLYDALWDGLKNAIIVSIPVSFALAILLFVINVFYKNSKS